MDLGFPGAVSDEFREGTSRIGRDLRAARERLGWEIDAVAEALRLKPDYIRAIEAGDLGRLPAPAYAVGFVRTYATALGLDPNESIRRFRAERDEVNAKTRLAFPAPVPQRGVPAGALVLVGAIIAIGGYIGWYHYSGRSLRSAQTVMAPPAHLEPLAPPPTPKLAAATPPPVAPKAAKPPSVVASQLPSDANVSPSSAAAAVPMPSVGSTADQAGLPVGGGGESLATAAPQSGQAPVQAGNGSAAPSGDGSTVAGSPSPMVIQATADAWIEIKNAAGKVVYQTILHPGDSYKVPDQPQLTLTTGNAAGTEIVLAGNTIGPLKGHVLRNIPLDASSLKAASVQPAVSAPTAQ
ncbi:MAG: helix-turn-helix domain-containing protein [Proteobacteria bacterium]|nr:helix-turn-helix domain-containing protein [Pseudomonadota bacterium]